ncbi:MAG: dimethylsulfonioproprionate lyase family protein [Paracoccaceae bacterium]|nr:dimethylsulfonioproprionate lyase family protein [Paracoccaceae bacterium]
MAVAPLDAIADLDWSQVFTGGEIDSTLTDGMIAAQLTGSYGSTPSDKIACGLLLLSPGVRYQLHTHAADEIYLCLSGTQRLQHGLEGTTFDLMPGQYLHTLPHRLHSLQVTGAPVLLAYLWIGTLTDPSWWWSQDVSGSWIRAAWRRSVQGTWRPKHSKPTTPEIMAQAHH